MTITIRPRLFVPPINELPAGVARDSERPVQGQPPVVAPPAPDTASRADFVRTLQPVADRPPSAAQVLHREIREAADAGELALVRERIERLAESGTRTRLLADCDKRAASVQSRSAARMAQSTRVAHGAVARLESMKGRRHVSVAEEYRKVGELLTKLPKNAETAQLKRDFLDAGAAYFSEHEDDDSITLTRTQVLRPIRETLSQVLRSDPQGILRAYTGDLDPATASDEAYAQGAEELAGVMKALADDHGTVEPFGSAQERIDRNIAATLTELVKAGDSRFMTLVSATAQGYVAVAGDQAEADQKARDRLSGTLGLALNGITGGLGGAAWQGIAASAAGGELINEILPEGPDRFGEAADDIATMMGRAQRLLDLYRAPERELARVLEDHVAAINDGVAGAVSQAERFAGFLRTRQQTIESLVENGVADPHVQRSLETEREKIALALDSLDRATGRAPDRRGTAERALALLEELAGIETELGRVGSDTEEVAVLRVRRLEAQLELRRLQPRLERRGASSMVERARAALAGMDRRDPNAIVGRLGFLEDAILDSEPGARREALLAEARGLLDLLEMQATDTESLVAGEQARREEEARPRDEGARRVDPYAGDSAFLSLGHRSALMAEAKRLRQVAAGFLQVPRVITVPCD